jgi:hypothetical protein
MSGPNPRNVVRGVVVGLGWLAMSLVGCRIDGETVAGDGASTPRGDAACTKGNREAGESLVAELRSQRLTAEPSSGMAMFTDHRASLHEACESGCGVACLEFARTSVDPTEPARYNKKACELGETSGCTLADPPTLEGAAKLCELGDALACATALALEFEAEPEQQLGWDRVAKAATAGCDANDGRSCSVDAWVRCAASSSCDATAIASASKAASLLPISDVVETLALVHCHAGAREDADASLAAACEAGHNDSCARRCEVLRDDRLLLVREAERATYDRILTWMALQGDVAPHWYVVLSAMDAVQLAGFENMLARFTPPMSDAGAKALVPAAVRERFPVLVEAVLRSPQLDAKQIRYWFGRLPDMTEEQRVNLLGSLRNQWWVIAGEPGKSPRSFVERVRLQSGGLAPMWIGG